MSKIPGSAHLNLTMGGLVILGGAMGFVKKGSQASLIAGLAFGSLFLGSGYMIANDREYQGHMTATGASSLMALIMHSRFLQTHKFMPAGLVAVMGLGCATYNYKKAQAWAPSPEEEEEEKSD